MTHLYISGTPSGSEFFLEEEARRSTYRLFSLHGNYLKAVSAWVKKAKKYNKLPNSLMLDSGAYTAWNKGHKTSVDEVIHAYSTIIDACGDMFEHIWAINLDVIPGERGRTPTQLELDNAIKESDINLSILQDKFGDIILPVFHQGENNERLDKVCSQAHYVCMSPRNDVPETKRVQWAREVHLHTANNLTHGLATTGTLMLTVPWHSVDSATSIHEAAYGRIMFYIDGGLKKMFVSLDDDKHKIANAHLDTLPEYIQQLCHSIIKEDMFDLEELRTNVKSRVLFNITQMSKYVESAQTKQVEQVSLFGV